MSFGLRTWLFAIMILFVAEDFQYALKIGGMPVLEHNENSQTGKCDDYEEESGESKGEKEEEKKEEKKEKDEDKNTDPDDLVNACSRLDKNKFRHALYPPSDIAYELESPPPEV